MFGKNRKIYHTLFVFSFLIVLGTVVYTFFLPSRAFAAAYTWDGGGGTENWSDCDNWSTNVCPLSGDTVTFNGTSTKNSTVDASWGGTVTSVTIASGYTGTITQQRSLTTSGNFTQSAGFFTASNQSLSVAELQLNTGSDFTASSGTVIVNANLTINGGSFHHNSGTLSFEGSHNSLISCNNVTFNLVTFVTAFTKTVANNCNLPLGNNPSNQTTLIINGTLSGTGTLTKSAGNLTLQNGGALSGFSGLTALGFIVGPASGQTANSNVDLSTLTTVSILDLTLNTPTNGFATSITVPSGTTVVRRNFTINTGTTFNGNNGTVNFSESSGTITCNGTVNFGSASFAGATGTAKIVSSPCNLPLGNNPSIPNSLTIGGTLSGTGTLTTVGTFTMNPGGSLSGFTGFSTTALTVSGATANFSALSSFLSTSTLTLSSGSLTLPNGADLNSTLAISGGTFNAPSGTMTLAGALTITNHPSTTTFNANGGTITFDGSGGALACNNVTFNLVTFAHTGGTKTVGTECNLPLGSNAIVPTTGIGAVTVNGTLSGTGSITPKGLLTVGAAGTVSGFTSLNLDASVTTSGSFPNLTSLASCTSGQTFTISAGTITLSNVNCNGTVTVSGGTLNIGTSGATISALNVSSGTFNVTSGSLTTTDIALSGTGILTASPATTSVSRNLNITAGTFNHNNGTVDFNGTFTGTLNCNNVGFNAVTFTHTQGTKTINSTCNLPLSLSTMGSGTAGITLNGGQISGSGTLTSAGTGNFTIQNGGSLNTFTGLSSSGPFILAATTANNSLNLSSYTTVDFNSSFAINTPTNPFTNTFTAPTGEMTVTSSFTINTGTSFNANNGTLTFDGTLAGTISCNNTPFNLVNIHHTANQTKTIQSNCNLPLGNNPTITNRITLNGGILSGSGTLTSLSTSSSAFRIQNAGNLSGFTGINAQGVFDIRGSSNIDMSGYDFATFAGFGLIETSTFTAPATTMTVNNDFQVADGSTFNHNGGTVAIDSDLGIQTLHYSNLTFYNLSRTSPITTSLFFTAGSTTTVLGTLTLEASNGNLLSLSSTSPGTQWEIDAQGSRTLYNLNVQDSNNINGTVMTAYDSVDSGNNINWAFAISPTPGSLNFHLISPADTSYINNNRPAFVWSAATSSIGASIDHYVFQMDNGNLDGNWELLNIPAYQQGGYFTSKYQVQYQGFDDDNPNNNYVVLSTNGSSDWGIFENQGQIDEGQQTWSVTAFDTQGNSYQLSRTVLLDQTQPATTVTRIPSAAPVRGQTNSYTTRNRQPTIFGSVLDPLNGTWPPDTIASGPSQVNVLIEKRNLFGLYTWQTTQVLPVVETFWTADNGLVNDNFQNTSSKYTRFSFAPQQPLVPGNYKVTFIGQDTAGNYQPSQSVFLRVQ